MNKHKRLSFVDSAKQITVFEVKSLRGMGTEEDPMEQITEYFLPNGTRIARTTVLDKIDEIHEWKK